MAVAALVTSIASHAMAEVPNLKLTWDAPVGCPSRSDVERSVDRLLGGRPPDDRRIDARVTVVLRPSGLWLADIEISGSASGRRELEGESCSAIALATAVVLAFAVDPQAAPTPPEEPRVAAAPPEAPIIKESVAEPTVPLVHAFGGALVHSLPALSFEFGAGAGARHGRWEAELMLAYAPARSVQVTGPPRAGAEINLMSATALGCFAPVATPATALELCVGGDLERMAAEATGVSNPGSGSVVLLSPMAALRSRTRLTPRLALVLDFAATVRPFHPRFVIDGVGQVYDIPVVGGSFAGGLQLGF